MTQPIPAPEPQPVPVVVAVAPQLMSDGSQSVRFEVHDVTGHHVSFLPPDAAVQLGEQMINAGKQAKTGLLLSKNLPARPNGAPFS